MSDCEIITGHLVAWWLMNGWAIKLYVRLYVSAHNWFDDQLIRSVKKQLIHRITNSSSRTCVKLNNQTRFMVHGWFLHRFDVAGQKNPITLVPERLSVVMERTFHLCKLPTNALFRRFRCNLLMPTRIWEFFFSSHDFDAACKRFKCLTSGGAKLILKRSL